MLNVLSLKIPPLREREGETGVLANYFLSKEVAQQKKGNLSFSDDARAVIDSYEWPGNVRELINRIKRAVIMVEGKQITAQDLQIAAGNVEAQPLNLREVREKAECNALLLALSQAGGNVSQASQLLGITRPTFYALVKRYELDIGKTGS